LKAAAGKIFFSAIFWGKYSEWLDQCFQRTRGQPHFLQVCWDADFLILSPVFGMLSVKGIREGGSTELFAVEIPPGHDKIVETLQVLKNGTSP